MKLFIKTNLSLLALFFTLTSATFRPNHSKIPINDISALTSAVTKAKDDGKISKKELKFIAKTAKGSSLSTKDKIALFFLGKKIGNRILTEKNGEGHNNSGKSQITALLLCIFLGDIGIHRYYLGYTWQGVVQTLTLGGLGIWSLIDLIRIIYGDLTPKNRDYDTTF